MFDLVRTICRASDDFVTAAFAVEVALTSKNSCFEWYRDGGSKVWNAFLPLMNDFYFWLRGFSTTSCMLFQAAEFLRPVRVAAGNETRSAFARSFTHPCPRSTISIGHFWQFLMALWLLLFSTKYLRPGIVTVLNRHGQTLTNTSIFAVKFGPTL